MDIINGIEVNGRIDRYNGILSRTNCGILINFHNGEENLQGIFPGCSWDDYYDILLPTMTSPTNIEIQNRYTSPISYWSSKPIGICSRNECNANTNYRYCSLKCWYINLINVTNNQIRNSKTTKELNQATNFKNGLEKEFGSLVDCHS